MHEYKEFGEYCLTTPAGGEKTPISYNLILVYELYNFLVKSILRAVNQQLINPENAIKKDISSTAKLMKNQYSCSWYMFLILRDESPWEIMSTIRGKIEYTLFSKAQLYKRTRGSKYTRFEPYL